MSNNSFMYQELCILHISSNGPIKYTERTSISLELLEGKPLFLPEDKESHFSLYGQGKKLSISQLTTAAASQPSTILLRKVQKSPKEKRNLRIGFLDGYKQILGLKVSKIRFSGPKIG